MQLITFHKILIGFAIAFFLLFGVREAIVSHSAGGYVTGAIAILTAVGMMYYLRWVVRTYPRSKQQQDREGKRDFRV